MARGGGTAARGGGTARNSVLGVLSGEEGAMDKTEESTDKLCIGNGGIGGVGEPKGDFIPPRAIAAKSTALPRGRGGTSARGAPRPAPKRGGDKKPGIGATNPGTMVPGNATGWPRPGHVPNSKPPPMGGLWLAIGVGASVGVATEPKLARFAQERSSSVVSW
mmetsp:Transcript_156902/g.278361  ORF Transcript_156902/g.278361 Transcript_156902/m.278361 type:complete len:163 (-) Transcript_156902:442-930(-)